MGQFAHLTSREEQVLALIAEGHCNKDIAALLGISVYTVQNHVCQLIHKLGVTSRTAAAREYWRKRVSVPALAGND